MNRRNKILTRITYAIFAVFLFVSIAVSASVVKSNVQAEQSTNPTLSISTDIDAEGYIYARNDGNYIYFELSLDSAPAKEVTVYFHAEDRSAIAEAGDYYYVETDSDETDNKELAKTTHKVSYVKINEFNYKSVTIQYHVSSVDYASIISTTERAYNTFKFCIDKVDGAILSGDSSYTCRINYNYALSVTQKTTGELNCDYFSTTFEDKYTFDLDGAGEINSYFNLCGNMADEVFSKIFNKTSANGYGEISLNCIVFGVKSNYKTGYDMYYDVYVGNEHIANSDLDQIKKDGHYYDQESYKTDMEVAENHTDQYYVITYNNQAGERKQHWYYIPAGDGYTCQVKVRNNGNHRTGWGYVYSRLDDRVAPTVKEYYIDTSSILYDGKIRLLMRYSEPVDANNSTVTGSIQSNYDILFKYTEGSGTNTLVYEANVNTADLQSESISASYIALKSINPDYRGEGVTDIGWNWKTSSRNKTTFKFDGYDKVYVSLDLRKPMLEDAPILTSGDITRTRNINVVCNKMTNGKIYYAFVPANEVSLSSYITEADFQAIIANADGIYNNFVAGYQDFFIVDNEDDNPITYTIASPSGLNGEYYLYLLAVSSLGKTDGIKYGKVVSGEVTNGYAFDNEAPTFTVTKSPLSALTTKIYNFTIEDKFTNSNLIGKSSGLSEIYLKVYDSSKPDNITNFVLWSIQGTDCTTNHNALENSECKLTDSFTFSIVQEDNGDGLKNYLKCGTKVICELSDIDYGTYNYYFYAVDKLGNMTTISDSLYTIEKYDLRTLFTYTWESNRQNVYSKIDNVDVTGIEENVFNRSTEGSQSLILTLTNTEDNADSESEVLSIYKIYYQGNLVYTKDVDASYNDYLTTTTVTNGIKKNLKVTPLKSGHYVIELVMNRKLTGSASGEDFYAADPVDFYVTDRSNTNVVFEETTNYNKINGNLVFNNKVFQLGTNFYYINSANNVTIAPYNNCQSPASFSNTTIATSYVTYMEYRDLQILQIPYDQDGAQIVTFLNSSGGSSVYQKADGQEGIKAALGQTWVRYKRSSWTTTSGNEGWAYYFYSDALLDSINIAALLGNDQFKNALTQIVASIIKQGSFVYLTEDNYLDNYGAPTLRAGQYHYSSETSSTTMNGDAFSATNMFEGDPNIFADYVEVSNKKYKLATNMKLNVTGSNLLYYYNKQAKELVKINAKDGQTLRDALGSSVGSGVYKIIEIDKNGVSEFDAYVDNDAPVVSISWVGTGDNSQDQSFTTNLNGRNDGGIYSAKNMTISSSSALQDIDEYAYVAVYTAPSYSFVSIQYYKTLSENPIFLENGNYYVVIGDRSGNVYTIKVQVCSEDLQVKITVNNSCVNVWTNRSEDQIDRYEVKCNNVIVNKEYNPEGNTYTETGYYNIYIKDIYGNTNSNDGSFGESYMFERELPKLTWYYLDSSGSSIPYEEGKTKIMMISRGLENGIFYINTSRYLKFSYEDEYEYSITGVDSSCVEKSQIGRWAKISATDNWELEIWYSQYPDVKAKYIVVMDTTAPQVQVSYRVSSYELADLDDMIVKAISAKVGSYYTLTSVNYNKGNTTTRNVSEGDMINSSFMTLDVSDASGLKSVYIYLNDELLKSYENIQGKFPSVSLGKSGAYRIVASDSFDNTRTYEFTNGETENLTAKIDGTKVLTSEDVLYGNNDFVISTAKDCQILINVGSYILYYTLKDGKLYQTRYVCIEEGEDKVFESRVDTKLVDNKEVENPFFDIDSSKVMAYTEKQFIANNFQIEEYSASTKLKGVKFFVSYDSNKNIIFRFACSESERMYIESTVLYNNYDAPYHFNLVLSKEVTEISFITSQSVDFNPSYKKVSRINDSFTPVLNNTQDIKRISASYSETKEFINFVEVYGENGYKAYKTNNNGFYIFRVENIFGNIIEYVINRSDIYTVLAFAEYEDLETSSFDSSFGENLIKSNYRVKFEAYTDMGENLEFVLKNVETNQITNVKGQYIDGYYSFVFNEKGKYKFTLTDTFGNVVVKNFEIVNTVPDVKDEILSGFNENALLKDKGYTNNKISIVKSYVNSNDVTYISLITTVEGEDKGVRTVTKTEKIIYNTLTQDAIGMDSRYAYVVVKVYKYYTENVATIVSMDKYIVDLMDNNNVVEVSSSEASQNTQFDSKFVGIIGVDGNNDYQVLFRDSYGGIARKEVHYKNDPTLTITRKTRTGKTDEEISIDDAISNGIWSNATVDFNTSSIKFQFKIVSNGNNQEIQSMPYSLNITANGNYIYDIVYVDEYGNNYSFKAHLVRQELDIDLEKNINSFIVEDVVTTRDNIQITYSDKSTCTYRLNGGNEVVYNKGDVLYRDGSYRFTVTDYAGNVTTKTYKKDTICEFTFRVPQIEKVLINGEVINTGSVRFETKNDDTTYISKVFYNDVLTEEAESYSKAGKWSFIIQDKAGNKTMFEFYIVTHDLSVFSYTTPNNYKITELWFNDGNGILVDYMQFVNEGTANSDFTIDENGSYSVVMTSTAFNNTIDFSFTINKSLPNVKLTGCNEGEKTINAVSIDGCKEGDIVKIYKDNKLYKTVEITEKSDVPVITEGGRYEIVVINQAGMEKSLSFIRTKIPNIPGSILIIVFSLLTVAGVIIGTILRNRQKIDD